MKNWVGGFCPQEVTLSTLPFTEYHQSGYSVIPVITTSAAPFEKDWSRWSTQKQAQAVVEEYEKKYRLPAHGVGLVLGPASGVVALDIDSESKDILDLCPPSPVRKRGSKGETRFFRPAPGLTNVRAKRPNTGPNKDKEKQEGVELLGAGCQTVIPPSINRKTNQPYTWVTPDTLLDVKPEDLPILTQAELDRVARYITGSVAGTEGSGSSAGVGSGIQGAAGRNEALAKVVWAMLNDGPGRSDHDLATELLGVDAREFGARAYFADRGEEFTKKHKTAFDAALAFVKYHRKQLARKGSATPKKTMLNPSPLAMQIGEGGELPDPANAETQVKGISRFQLWEQLKIEVSSQGNPRCNFDSAHKILEGIPELRESIWFDSFYNNVMTTLPSNGIRGSGGKEGRPWSETDTLFIMKYAQSVIGLPTLGKDAIMDAVVMHARSRARHAVRDWLGGLPEWDGTPRLASFFSAYLGSPQNEYTSRAGINFFLSLIARVMEPGCKADCMPILEGVQGLLKSTALRRLAGDRWFGELTEDLDNKDAYMLLHGKWIVEIPELDSLLKADPKTVKRMLSTQVDRFRPPYGRLIEEFPRQFVFAGTTNEADYLKDPTGGRRFWPVACERVDLDGITRDREQLFSEALWGFNQPDRNWWEMPESAKKEVAARTEVDGWVETIATWITDGGREKVTSFEIATQCLDISDSAVHSGHMRRIASCLRGLGWKEDRSEVKRFWIRGV